MKAPLEMPSPVPSRAETIDRFGTVYWEIERLKPELESLKGTINGWYADHPADQPAFAEGVRYCLQGTARENKRKITNKWKAFQLLKKILGLAPLVELLTIPLKEAVDKHIPEEQHKLFLVKERTGPRTWTPVPRAEEMRKAA